MPSFPSAKPMTSSFACAEPFVCGPASEGHAPTRQAAALAQAAWEAAAASSATQQRTREEAGLPDLCGSASDIAAAMVIRARALRRLRLDLAERIREEASARWWIDHRHQVCG